LRESKNKDIMNTETLTVHQRGDDFEIIVQHDQTGSALGTILSKSAYEQLRLHFVSQQRELLIDFCEVYATGNFGGADSENIVDWYLKVKDN
jgi:hypothetical protein